MQKITNKTKTNNFKLKGFTLVELLVSVSLFSFVTYVAISALFSMQILNQKLKSTKVIYDNIYTTMDNITSDIRQGNNFINTSPSVTSCTTPTTNCIFFDYLNVETGNKLEKRGYYLEGGHVKKYSKENDIITTSPKIQDITSDDLVVNYLKFDLVGADTYAAGNTQQPMIKIIIEGVTRALPVTPFHIENIISQRSLGN